jgi:predicted dehydrogenase
VVGDAGEMRVLNPIAPQFFHRLRVRTQAGRSVERVAGGASYTHQLRAFARAVQQGEPVPTDGAHGVANMTVIDAIYRKAGLRLRGS